MEGLWIGNDGNNKLWSLWCKRILDRRWWIEPRLSCLEIAVRAVDKVDELTSVCRMVINRELPSPLWKVPPPHVNLECLGCTVLYSTSRTHVVRPKYQSVLVYGLICFVWAFLTCSIYLKLPIYLTIYFIFIFLTNSLSWFIFNMQIMKIMTWVFIQQYNLGEYEQTQLQFTSKSPRASQYHWFINFLLDLFFSHTPFRKPASNAVQVVNYSSSIVAGGLLVMSSITRHTPYNQFS